MNTPTQRALLNAKHLNLGDLRAKDPALAEHIVAVVRKADAARLNAYLKDLPDDVRAKVAAIDLVTTPGHLLDHLVAELRKLDVEETHIESIVKHATKIKLGEPTSTSTPVDGLPGVQAEVAAAQVHEVATLAGLSRAAAAGLGEAAVSTSALDDATLTKLVSRSTLTAEQAKAVGFSATVYALTDQTSELASAIQSASFPKLSGKAPNSVADLAKLAPSDWTEFLTSSKALLPAGATPQSAGIALAKRLAVLEPNVAFFHRLPQPSTDQLTASLTSLAPLFELDFSKPVVGTNFANVGTTGLTADQITTLQGTHGELQKLSNAYPGLGLAGLFDDPAIVTATKVSTATRLIGIVQQVGARLGSTQGLMLDLTAGSSDIPKLGLNELTATADEQTKTLETLKAYQRVHALAMDIDAMHTVVGAGFTSALSISTLSRDDFAGSSGLNGEQSTEVWTAARTSMADVSLSSAAIRDIAQDVSSEATPWNVGPSVKQYLQQLPGYADLFGNLSFCDCDECQSILGPAAYFVDLMKFIEDNLLNQFKTSDNPLDLRLRRPDLWTLVLSCDNTNNRVPTLDIVNLILENFIAGSVQPKPPITERAKIWQIAYEQTLAQVGRQGAPVVRSFAQPFYLPIARVRAYLAALGSSPAAAAAALAPSASTIAAAQAFPSTVPAQAELGLSADELTVITTPSTQLAQLSVIYGISFSEVGSTIVAKGAAAGTPGVDASLLGPAMGLSRSELGTTVASAFVSAGGSKVSIVGGMTSSSSVQNDVEWVEGLTVDALDRMHRFTRMVHKTGWAIGDLDLVLTALLDTTLGVSGVQTIAQLHALQLQFSLRIGELCALVGAIPGVTAQTPAGQSFFDSLFNPLPFAAGNSLLPVLPAGTQIYVLPAGIQNSPVPPGTQSTATSLSMTARLLTGLGITLSDLEVLVTTLSTAPGAPLAVTNGGFLMSAGNLSLLYRHARLARLLGLSISQTFQLLKLAGIGFIDTPQAAASSGKMPASLANLLGVLDVWSWQRQSGYSIDDIVLATGGVPLRQNAYPDPVSIAKQLVAAATKSLTFTGTVFSVALGTPEQGSLDLLTGLASGSAPLVVQSPHDGSWSLAKGVDIGNVDASSIVTIPIPATATVAVPASGNTPATTPLVSGSAVLQALKAYVAPGATFTDVALASALKLTSTTGAGDLLSILAATNPPLVQNAAGNWSLKQAASLSAPGLIAVGIPSTATVSTPATATTPAVTALVSAAEILSTLKTFQPSEVLTRSLATALGLDTGKLISLATLAGQSLASEAVAQVVRGATPVSGSPTPDALSALVSALIPLSVVFRPVAWNSMAVPTGAIPTPPALNPIDFVRLNPQVFGTGPLPVPNAQGTPPAPGFTPSPCVSLDQLRSLSTYATFSQAVANAPAASGATLAGLQSLLPSYNGASTPPAFPTATVATIAQLLSMPTGIVANLNGTMPLSATPVIGLAQISVAAQMAVALGVDGATLATLGTSVARPIATDYEALSTAADTLSLAIGARYAAPAEQASKLDEAEQPVREAKRDALADYLIRSFRVKGAQAWSNVNALYEYFLIDVAAGGCMTTSWVVSATMSAQLYVYRAMMHLEQNALQGKTGFFALTLPDEAAEQWEWRKNYRVWQANREVFLWPENYMDPDLRSDVTPLFADLKTQLLQANINDQSASDAYNTYLKGFDEVSSLNIAGAYHDVLRRPVVGAGIAPLPDFAPASTTDTRDVLHLFGTTAVRDGDAPAYYYRTCKNLIASGSNKNIAAVWSPWQNINVQVSSSTVSPVIYEGRLHLFWIGITTRPQNTVSNGNSTFTGYLHTMSMHFTTLRQDGTWTSPQTLRLPSGAPFSRSGAGQIRDPLNPGRTSATLDATGASSVTKDTHNDVSPVDDYTLVGPSWSRAWFDPSPSALKIQFRNFKVNNALVDLFRREVIETTNASAYSVFQVLSARTPAGAANTRALCSWTLDPSPAEGSFLTSALANAVADENSLSTLHLEDSGDSDTFIHQIDPARQIATIPTQTQVLAIPGSEQDALLQIDKDVLLLQGSVTSDGSYLLRRVGTVVTAQGNSSVQGGLAQIFFEHGLDVLLATGTQASLAEAPIPITIFSDIDTSPTKPSAATTTSAAIAGTGGDLFNGPYGMYYGEVFFLIPFLIANALNAHGQFEAAARWYNYIFDPTSSDQTPKLDRVWKFIGFRGLTPPKLRDILTDVNTIAAYKADPFNPWSIARNRPSAFQKTIVMHYVDNLLDWADTLFAQFTMESVNEAEMLYIMASDIMGPRPADVGDCGAGSTPVTYNQVRSRMGANSDFLVEVESWTVGARRSAYATPVVQAAVYAPAPSGLQQAIKAHSLAAPVVAREERTVPSAASGISTSRTGIFEGLGWNQYRTSNWAPALSNATTKTSDAVGGRSFASAKALNGTFVGSSASFPMHTLRQVALFCVPPNPQLLALWDRIEDRLHKIRNCMDIDGKLRQLALFAPAINPMDLVAMTAAGLSLEDVLGTSNGDLPPYRFLYLIEKAKAYAGTLISFGSMLLSSLEKKDGEHLNRLRLTQQINLTQAMSSSLQMDIDAANAAYSAVTKQLQSAQSRSDHYAGLISGDRNAWEIAESIALHTGSVIGSGEAAQCLLMSVLGLIPQVGSPFAMKFGGVELFHSMKGNAEAAAAYAKVAEAVAASSHLEAGFARRTEEWQYQKQLADYDVQVLTQQQTAAQIRVSIATNAVTVHQKNLDQMQAFLDVTDGKFTNLGLYTWLSSALQGLFRRAYQNALSLANLAQQAFQFERGDYSPPVIVSSSYWNPTYSGLLAGERLLLDLQALERRFIETNYRTFEVDQPFALSQVDPSALLALRETGQCEFTIPEVFFDLFYPGHYKRRIKAVRLTIPCITGPYVNVGATLELLASYVRTTTDLTDKSQPQPVPPTRTVTIATSTAQNDAGVFELSFRDERYMPFEGLGAVSQWRIMLPSVFRQFDYETINDAILSISYAAVPDGALRQAVEGQLGTIKSSITSALSDPNNPGKRLFSLRQDFSSAFTRLLRSPAGTPVTIELSDRNFPMFIRGRALALSKAVLLLRTAPGAPLSGFSLTVDGTALGTASNAFTPANPASATDPTPTFGGLPYVVLPAFTLGPPSSHTLAVSASAPTNLAPSSAAPGDVSAIDGGKLHDILLYVEYYLS